MDALIVDERHHQLKERGLQGAIVRGDKGAWRLLYDQCFDSVYAFVDFRTRHRRDRTEEVVQETWMVAVRRIGSFDPMRSSFETWMRGIAANVLRNHWRVWKRLESCESVETVSMEAKPDSNVDLAEQIGLTLTTLPSRYRSVLQAKYEEKLSVVEIAQRWTESPKAVESLLTRARKAFRTAFRGLEKEA